MEEEDDAPCGRIEAFLGTVIVARDMIGVAMYEVVHVGPQRLVGEVIRLERDTATLQLYEHMAGLKVGDPVYATKTPMTIELGPGLLGEIFDGIQRPFTAIAKKQGAYYLPGSKINSLDREKHWYFVPNPTMKEGDTIEGGDIYGEVVENSLVVHHIMLSPKETGLNIIKKLAPAGKYTVEDVVLEIERAGELKKLTMMQTWPVRMPRGVKNKLKATTPFLTGQRILDTFFTTMLGGTVALVGGNGTGKTELCHSFMRLSNVDITIYVGCGERGNEIIKLYEESCKTETVIQGGRKGASIQRSVIIANTSDMPLAAREMAVYTGVTIAEYFRDMGYNVALMVDSLSRWTDMLQQTMGRLPEMPSSQGYPAYLGARLASFYERAGVVECTSTEERHGSLTIIGCISPPSGDFSDSTVSTALSATQTFWGLDEKLPSLRHWPAINAMQSHARYAKNAEDFFDMVDPELTSLIRKAKQLFHEADELSEIVRLVGQAIPQRDTVVVVMGKRLIEDWMLQDMFSPEDGFCPLIKTSWMLRNILLFYELGLKAISEDKEPTCNWWTVTNHTADIRKKLSAMKFEPPDSPSMEIKFKALYEEICVAFAELNE